MGDGRAMVDEGHQLRAGVGPRSVDLLIALLYKTTNSLPHSAGGERRSHDSLTTTRGQIEYLEFSHYMYMYRKRMKKLTCLVRAAKVH